VEYYFAVVHSAIPGRSVSSGKILFVRSLALTSSTLTRNLPKFVDTLIYWVLPVIARVIGYSEGRLNNVFLVREGCGNSVSVLA
jgi:hypothetical protein